MDVGRIVAGMFALIALYLVLTKGSNFGQVVTPFSSFIQGETAVLQGNTGTAGAGGAGLGLGNLGGYLGGGLTGLR